MKQNLMTKYLNHTEHLNMFNHHFTAIGLSEIWLHENDIDLYGLCDYKS